jgi:hypothetical protein
VLNQNTLLGTSPAINEVGEGGNTLSMEGLAFITRNICLLHSNSNNSTNNYNSNDNSNDNNNDNNNKDIELNNNKFICNEILLNMSPTSRNIYQNSKLLNYITSLLSNTMTFNR